MAGSCLTAGGLKEFLRIFLAGWGDLNIIS